MYRSGIEGAVSVSRVMINGILDQVVFDMRWDHKCGLLAQAYGLACNFLRFYSL